jgi:hypothetical protein
MFGRKSRRERLEERAQEIAPVAALVSVYKGARPVIERLLYDDELRDNIRVFIDSARSIVNELSDEDLDDAISKLWDDRKVRRHVEAAVEAAQQGSKRVRGQRVRKGGGGRWVLLLLVAAGAFLFLNPRTGPEARKFVREAYSAIASES